MIVCPRRLWVETVLTRRMGRLKHTLVGDGDRGSLPMLRRSEPRWQRPAVRPARLPRVETSPVRENSQQKCDSWRETNQILRARRLAPSICSIHCAAQGAARELPSSQIDGKVRRRTDGLQRAVLRFRALPHTAIRIIDEAQVRIDRARTRRSDEIGLT